MKAAFSNQRDFIFTNEFFLNFAHGFLILKRNLLPHSFTAEIQFPVLGPISGLDFFIFFKSQKWSIFAPDNSKWSIESRNYFQ